MKLLYLDFDGVLHDDAVYWHPKHGIYLATPNCTLFEWMHILEALLEPHPDIFIILSTSWVRVKSYEFAKKKLSPNLQSRVVGATFHNREMQKADFDFLSRGYQILADVKRRQPSSWFAIDNDDEGWPIQYRENLVLTTDRLGISEETVQNSIREMLLRM
jgi:hypothetical protein